MSELQSPHGQPDPAPPAPSAAVRPKLRHLILPYIALFLFIVSFCSGCLFMLSLHVSGPMTEDQTVVIPRGSSVQEIAQILDTQNVLVNKMLFRLSAYMMAHNQLRAGEYLIPKGSNVLDVTKLLQSGKTVIRQLTIPEGLTSYEIVTLLNNTAALSGAVEAIPPEGSLRPETYNYALNDSRADMIKRMQQEAQTLLQSAWEGRDKDLPFASPQEALILASVVEKETGKLAEERPRVASVFINRLSLRMPLQSDPTVLYDLTDGTGSLGRKLTRADLLLPSPHNTYTNAGLPPSPICNPGKAAIEAVLHPEKTSFLYFVANGTGGHAFAKNLDEHNRNVANWFKMNREP
ncbi:MAG: endolytic transglycosylase MltG [Alphaproteobacteria bacterium]|nr:endolytic transglycosylase MltG [Alphaproteobacteria bacterium]